MPETAPAPPATVDPLLEMSVEIVAAYVQHNSLPPADVKVMIEGVYKTLASIHVFGPPKDEEKKPPLAPAVPIKKSVSDDYIVCLEDGKKFRSLKRHLQSEYSMTPEQYRVKWSLSKDYPMVAPSYAKKRSELAKGMGLGRKSAAPTKAAA